MNVKLTDLDIEEANAEIGRVLSIYREEYVFLRPEAYQPRYKSNGRICTNEIKAKWYQRIQINAEYH